MSLLTHTNFHNFYTELMSGNNVFPELVVGGKVPHVYQVYQAAFGMDSLFGTSLLVGLSLFSFFSIAVVLRKNESLKQENSELHDKQRKLHKIVESQKSIINTEPHILFSWDQNEQPRLLHNSLGQLDFLPAEEQELRDFSSWLSEETSYELGDASLNLIAQGEPFNLVLSSKTGQRLEAEGRTSGGRALLKIRDLTGASAEFAQLKDEKEHVLQELLAARELLDHIPLPVWFRTSEGKVDWVNRAYATAVGIKDAALTISAEAELLENKHLTAIEKALEKDRKYHQKVPLVLGGHQQLYDLKAIRFVDAASAGYAQNIEEHEQAELNLKRYVSIFDKTLGQVSTAVAVFNSSQRLEFYNDAFVNMWKFDQHWLDEKPSSGHMLDQLRVKRQLPDQTDYAEWKENVLKLAGTMPGEQERWDLPNGQTIFVCALEGFDGGEIYCFENKTDQLALKQRYHTLNTVQRASLNALSEGVAVFASTGKLSLYNAAFARLWQLDVGFLAEEPHIDLVIEKCKPAFFDEVFWYRLKTAVTSIEESRQKFSKKIHREDGSYLLVGRVPMPEGSTMFTFHDITDSEQKEIALLERNEALESADMLKNSFISNISYELRTPLTSIIGFAEMLMAKKMSENFLDLQKEYIEGILFSGRELEGTINDILDLASIDAGKLELKKEEIETIGLFKDVSQFIQPLAVKNDVSVNIIPVKNKCQKFTADKARMKQVLIHLLSNAIGCSPEGSEVRLSCENRKKHIILKVSDRGPGIPKDMRETVFNRFESRAVPGKHRGAGLGLPMVKSLVELHGGTVALQSREGKGTQAVVKLPKYAPDIGSSTESEHNKKLRLLELEDIAREEKQRKKKQHQAERHQANRKQLGVTR